MCPQVLPIQEKMVTQHTIYILLLRFLICLDSCVLSALCDHSLQLSGEKVPEFLWHDFWLQLSHSWLDIICIDECMSLLFTATESFIFGIRQVGKNQLLLKIII